MIESKHFNRFLNEKRLKNQSLKIQSRLPENLIGQKFPEINPDLSLKGKIINPDIRNLDLYAIANNNKTKYDEFVELNNTLTNLRINQIINQNESSRIQTNEMTLYQLDYNKSILNNTSDKTNNLPEIYSGYQQYLSIYDNIKEYENKALDVLKSYNISNLIQNKNLNYENLNISIILNIIKYILNDVNEGFDLIQKCKNRKDQGIISSHLFQKIFIAVNEEDWKKVVYSKEYMQLLNIFNSKLNEVDSSTLIKTAFSIEQMQIKYPLKVASKIITNIGNKVIVK